MSQKYCPLEDLTPQVTPELIHNVGFLGKDSIGLEIADSLVRAGFAVSGYALNPVEFQEVEGTYSAATSLAAAACDAQVLVIAVSSATQVEDLLFGSGGAIESLPNGAAVILTSTFSPSFVQDIQSRLVRRGRNIDLVDAPVSEDGQIIASSDATTVLCRVEPVLCAITGSAKKLHRVEGKVGTASSINLVIQLLASVHTAAAAEAMSFAAKLGLDTKDVYEIIKNAAGGSWMFENRVPAMLRADKTPGLEPHSFGRYLVNFPLCQ